MEQNYVIPIPAVGTPLTVVQAMKLAISEAAKGAPYASPNPMVGSVVLDAQGNFISSGYHEIYGGPHAEVNAVKNLTDDQLKGAHVIVTLEPCAHEGKTPSCAKMLAKLPIKKVTFGLIDPNPLVAGQGAKILEAAGIEAMVFSDADKKVDAEMKLALEEACEAFLWNFRQKKVFVCLKMASSLDGQVALKNGESQWITGPESREHVHYLRSCYDAILVGKGTIEFDNPSLNIRHPKIQKFNKVIVLDGEADLLKNFANLKLAQVHKAESIFWCVAEEMKEAVLKIVTSLTAPPQVIFCKTKVGGDLDLQDMLAQIYKLGLRSLMVEGGAFTASSFIKDSLINRLYLFQAPHLMGAGGSRSWTESLRIDEMKNRISLLNPKYKILGNDFMITGRLT
jgi:diaminohydroxyphosphoribosylaminopyrimidine deaminase/5-amino-6-(5-phosphoribosylamino)uracil reductase